ncbi:MAG TPA: efflux RND transporter periplasmic adaptor subunit [Bacteroidales bacterium]|nr:efflux RND transporter periplasmic adaptor subunit [Bacteroidales bacterium]HPI85390.1 efflux RND transporter periplasmic adaptor subunit [Bacteroidales bacterium]
MKINSYKYLVLLFIMAACHDHSHDNQSDPGHEDEIKFQYTVYTDHFELFAEADAFLPGETANVLSHFSTLPGFKAVETGEITAVLDIGGREVRQTLDKPTRKGIYSFDIVPVTPGTGTLKFIINNREGLYELLVQPVSVYLTADEARKEAEKLVTSKTNSTVFTKEQSWKMDFATGFPETGPFGQVIKTSAMVQPAPGDEVMIPAKISGIVTFHTTPVPEGGSISAGQSLFTISAGDLADNNLGVRYQEAKNNYERLKAEYERKQELAKDKIVSEKELQAAKNEYENAVAQFELLNKHFSSGGQSISSPISGYIRHLYVTNGQYVEAGQQLVSVIKNKSLILKADIQQKYAPILGSIISANIRTVQDNRTYSLDELNGKMLSYGRSANESNYLIPVSLLVDNPGDLISGSFVELYLITQTNSQALTLPNNALIEEQGNFFVYVQITPELFEKREVKTGTTDGLRTEITRGINSGERIITDGAIFVRLAQATGTLDAHSGHNH